MNSPGDSGPKGFGTEEGCERRNPDARGQSKVL